jgi:O-methyltransferase
MITPTVERANGDLGSLTVYRTDYVRAMALRFWRTPGVNHVLRTSVRYAPAPVRQWIEAERALVHARERRNQVLHRARLVPEHDLRGLLRRGLRELTARHGRHGLGDYLEFGVYNGTSLTCMYRELVALNLHHVRLFGFDSFEGFPPSAAHEDEGRWQPGKCHATIGFTTSVLQAERVDLARVTLVPGWFADTLNDATAQSHQITKASVVMIDCDLYSSTKEALDFCAPLIKDEALIIFDEWNDTRFPNKDMGEKKAFYEFMKEWACFSAVPFGQYAERSQAFLVSRTEDGP